MQKLNKKIHKKLSTYIKKYANKITEEYIKKTEKQRNFFRLATLLETFFLVLACIYFLFIYFN